MVDELRRSAHGIDPVSLPEHGLEDALPGSRGDRRAGRSPPRQRRTFALILIAFTAA